jgi:hypothetical protein
MRLDRPIETCFRYGSAPKALNLATHKQLAGSLCKRHAVSLVGTVVPVQPPTACKQMVSGSFNSPSGVLFTFPSRYLCTIGRQRVFSLGRRSSQIPTGFHVSRGTRESSSGSQHAFVYRTVTFFGQPFQTVQLTCWFLTSRPVCTQVRYDPTTPSTQRVQA